MKQTALLLSLSLLAAPSALMAQSYSSSSSLVAAEASPEGGAGQTALPAKGPRDSVGPFSRIALGAGLSPLGIQLQAATNLSSHFNLRATGNFFNYSTNFTNSGITATAKLNLASAGASVDVYPFRAGFRISPGLLFYNGNQLTATTAVPGGTSFTLITTGWGNMIPRNGHWSFPFEIGVAVIGAPSVNVNLGGWACYDPAQTECTNISSTTNPIAIAIQSNLTAQVAKWTSDLNPLKTYPIVSAGVAYSFHIR
jgi:hypothetical protein